MRAAYDAALSVKSTLYYAVRDELDFSRGYSAVDADRVMFGFALEAVRAQPVRFAVNTLVEWVKLFVAPHHTIGVCDSAVGPHLCSERNDGYGLPNFPNAPTAGNRALKTALAAYFRHASALFPVFVVLAAAGIVMTIVLAAERRNRVRVLLLCAIVYFSILPVVFNTVEDRYRLPIDALVLLFAVHSLSRIGTARFARGL